MLLIMSVSIFVNGLSGHKPFKTIFFNVFMTIITPAMFLVIAVTHKDYGYDFVNRIMGEYKLNFFHKNVFNDFQFIGVAIFDAL